MNEKTLLPGNRECSHKFRTMPIKYPRCGRFVTPIKDIICYPLNIKHISQCIENFHHILYADSEGTLRQIVADFADKDDLDRYFVYGYGSHHLWLYLKSYIINT